jgi:hypothetical protein
VNEQTDSDRGPALLKALFFLVSVLVLGGMAYAAWIVISYWHRVGV